MLVNDYSDNSNFKIVSQSINIVKQRIVRSRKRWEWFTHHKHIVSSVPLHVDIEVTNICDLRCFMCERRFMKRPLGMMSLRLFKEIIDECSRIGVDSVKLNLWGESLLNKDFIMMVSYAKEHSPLILQFNTSALHLTPVVSRKLIQSGLDKITISIDSINPAIYERIRKGSNFKVVMKNIHTLLDIKYAMKSKLPYVTIQFLKTTENESEFTDFIAYWKKLVDVVSVTNIGVTTGNRNILKLSLRKASGKRKPCEQLWQRLSILWDGRITVCCNDYEGFLCIGKFGKDRFLDLWRCNELQLLRKRHMAKDFKGIVCLRCTETIDYVSSKF